jgi:hypothetical protein
VKLISALLLCCTGLASAQGKTDYTLNDGKVHFHVPANWTAVMEKSDGNPQATAFQVPDDAAQGSDDSATVTVKSRQMAGDGAFNAFVLEEFEHAKSQMGFEVDPSNKDAAVRQYFVQRGKTRYVVRDYYQQAGDIGVEVRCQRPLLEKTPAAWIAQFDSACHAVAASLK